MSEQNHTTSSRNEEERLSPQELEALQEALKALEAEIEIEVPSNAERIEAAREMRKERPRRKRLSYAGGL